MLSILCHFHGLSFVRQCWINRYAATQPRRRTRHETLIVIGFIECIGDKAIIENMACSSSKSEMLHGARRILALALPNQRVHSLETLEGGATNFNVLVRFEACDELLVLRQYLRGAEVCRKETLLLQTLQDLIPVPRLVKSDVTGGDGGIPYLIYRFLPGLTFRQIRASGSHLDMANAAHAIGRCLGVLQNQDIPLLVAGRLNQRLQITEHQLAHPLLRERIGTADLSLLHQTFAKWSPVLHRLSNQRSLVHGDFNHRNIVLSHKENRWEVTGILDWELAGIGSSLWDTARFMCYQKPDSVHWEPHFVDGFRTKGGESFPEEWEALTRVMNTLGAAVSLTSDSTQECFLAELKRLVHAGLRGERIG
jgi:aminoglycoside phosphotransferase (APT) family kinase protein